MAATRWVPTQLYNADGSGPVNPGGGGVGGGGSVPDLTTTVTLSTTVANLAALNGVVVSTTAVAILVVGDGRSAWNIFLNTMPASMTLNFAASYDGGATYHPTSGTQLSGTVLMTGQSGNVTTNANNIAAEQSTQTWFGISGTATHIAVWCSAVSSGSCSVRINASVATRHISVQGPVAARTNTLRATVVAHRASIAAVDKVATLLAASVTATGQTGGSLTTSTTYNWEVVPGNKYGTAGIPAASGSGSTATSTNTAVRLAFAAVTGAEYYDLFLSTDAAPKFVGRVTEAQRATGGLLTTASTGSAACVIGAGGAAGAIDVRVPGTGAQTTATNFAQNNAYTPDSVAAVNFVNCTGFSLVHIQVVLTLTDLFSAPTLSIVPFLYCDGDSFYNMAAAITVNLLGAVGQSTRQDFVMQTDGSDRVVFLVGSIAGNGASVSIYAQTA